VSPKNFGRTAVVVPPTPATSGLGFTVTSGTGTALLGTGPAVLVPEDTDPWTAALAGTIEVVSILKVAGDTITLSARAQESTTAQTVVAGWQVIQGITAGMWNDVAPDLVAELYTASGFTIGHRLGGADEAPEMSEIGSQQALGKGQRAVELSAQATVDGVMIGMHDTDPSRTTSLAATPVIADLSLAQLTSSPIIDIGATALGSGWSASQRVPVVGNELRRWERRGAVFLEPKSDATRTLAAATGFQDPGKWIVWKFNRGASGSLPSHATNARAAGLPLWVYMTSGDSNSLVDTVLATLQPRDAIGVDIGDSDANILYTCTAAARLGIPVIAFVVRLRSERDRIATIAAAAAVAAGVPCIVGYMCTAPTYVGNDLAAFTTDGFSGLVRRPGDYEGASNKLIAGFDATETSVTLAQGTTATLSMGSMCPIVGSASGYRIAFSARWATLPSDLTTHLDVYICHATDAPYAFQSAANVDGGYHIFQRANGGSGVSRHDPGTSTGTSLGTGTGSAAVANQWMNFNVDVTPTSIIFRRLDGTLFTITAASTTYRGLYFGLNSASASVAAQFKDITVTQL